MADPELPLTFTYDHASGLFWAQIPNGARFTVTRDEVSGKLAANLDLFRRAVIQGINPRKELQLKDRSVPVYDFSEVKRFTPQGHREVSLDELGPLDLGD